MTWENVKKKLTSRKLWVAVADFVGMLMIHFGAEPSSAESVVALILAGAGALAYVIAEGLIDKASADSNSIVTEVVKEAILKKTEGDAPAQSENS